ncbi:TonB dependent receptor [compost metagenome]
MYDAIGIFQNAAEIAASPFQSAAVKPGDVKYRDTNGDNKITSDDRIITGHTTPTISYGINLGASFRSFDFSAFLQGVANIDTYAGLNYATPFNNGAGVTYEWLNNSWSPENTGAKFPRLTTSNGYPDNFKASTLYLQDASYLRLKNIQLGYSLPKTLTDKIKIKRARIYVNGQNLLTVSNMKIVDPERSIQTANFYQYPSTKIYTMGVNVTF